ncbi:MAG: hypothetical protein CL610_27555 [Anaerolineaceae bacterium]|nr:hypothetical protein [Anaerolineaceae bacterium]
MLLLDLLVKGIRLFLKFAFGFRERSKGFFRRNFFFLKYIACLFELFQQRLPFLIRQVRVGGQFFGDPFNVFAGFVDGRLMCGGTRIDGSLRVGQHKQNDDRHQRDDHRCPGAFIPFEGQMLVGVHLLAAGPGIVNLIASQFIA